MSKNDMIDSSHVNRGQRPDYLGKEAFVFMNDSLQYYNQHAKEFSDSTRDVEFKEMQERFLVVSEAGSQNPGFRVRLRQRYEVFPGQGI